MGLDIYAYRVEKKYAHLTPDEIRENREENAKKKFEKKCIKWLNMLNEAHKGDVQTYYDTYQTFLVQLKKDEYFKSYEWKIEPFTKAILTPNEVEDRLKGVLEWYFKVEDAYFRKVNFIYAFFQDDLSFTDKGAPYCSKCYELHETYDVPFQCLGLDIVSRGDYESMPCPMYAGEFDDDKMTELARLIYQTLNSNYGYTDRELEKYFNDMSANVDEDLDMAFWKEMEEIAVQMGMRYYEDMTDDEYEEISKK